MNVQLATERRPKPARTRSAGPRRGGRAAPSPRGGTTAAPTRTCAGCGQRAAQHEVLRWVHAGEGGASPGASSLPPVTIDLKGGARGRGAWVHPRIECLDKAARHGFSRSFRIRVDVSTEQLLEQIRAAAERRLAGLIHAARASRALIFGRDSVREKSAVASLVLLAADSPSLSNAPFVTELGARGRLVIWGTKERYGTWMGRGDVAILAIMEHGLATRIAQTLALLNLAPQTVSGCGAADIVSEVR